MFFTAHNMRKNSRVQNARIRPSIIPFAALEKETSIRRNGISPSAPLIFLYASGISISIAFMGSGGICARRDLEYADFKE